METALSNRAEMHIFRLDDDSQTPMMREDMNFELGRLAEAAGIEHEVTTGMFRRLVAHKVFEQRMLGGRTESNDQTGSRSRAPSLITFSWPRRSGTSRRNCEPVCVAMVS